MSVWYETTKEDIAIDEEKCEVNLYITSDDSGSIYKILTFEQVIEIAEAIEQASIKTINESVKKLGW